MVEHIVLFRWRDGAPPEAIEAAIEGLRGLKTQIAGIVDLSCGADFSGRAKGFSHGLVVRFTDRAARDAYGPHPAHQSVVKSFIDPIRSEVLVCDYEWVQSVR